MGNNKGFTLMGMAVTVATLGILAVMARPAIETMFARARQAEVKSNLHEIKAVQTAHIRVRGAVFGFDKFGYMGGGVYKCGASDMPGEAFGWTPAACQTLRYNYEATAGKPQTSASDAGVPWTTNTYEVVAHAPADQGEQYLWAGCNGAGSSIYGHSSGDVWRLRMGGNPEVCRSILDFCPDVSTKARKRCDGQPFDGTTQCLALAPPGETPPATPVVMPTPTPVVAPPPSQTVTCSCSIGGSLCANVCGRWNDINCASRACSNRCEATRTNGNYNIAAYVTSVNMFAHAACSMLAVNNRDTISRHYYTWQVNGGGDTCHVTLHRNGYSQSDCSDPYNP